MLWFKQVIKQTVRTKLFVAVFMLLSGFIISKGIYHVAQKGQTIGQLTNQVKEFLILNQQKIDKLEQQHILNPVSYYQDYHQHLLEEYQALTAILVKLQHKNLAVASELSTYYQLYSQENQYDSAVLDDVKEELVFTEYLVSHDLPYMEAHYPFDNALFPLQVTQILFHFSTAFILIALFGLKIYRDRETEKFTFLYTLPLKRKHILKQYSWSLFMVVGSYVAMFLMSFLPMLMNQHVKTLLYPYVIHYFDQLVVYPVWQIIILKIVSWIGFVLFLHVCSLILVKICKSIDQNIVLLILICLCCTMGVLTEQWQGANPLAIIVQFEQWVYMPNTLVYALVYMTVLIGVLVMLYQCHYLTTWGIKTALVNQKNKKVSVSLPHKVYPYWFEWKKRLALPSTKFFLLLILALVGGSYLLVYFNASQALHTFRQDLVNDVVLFQNNMRHQELEIELALANVFEEREAEYKQRANYEQTFKEWIKITNPEYWDSLYFNYDQYQQDLASYQQLIQKIDNQTFQWSDLVAFRK